MIFLSLILFLATVWFLPWWAFWFSAVVLGLILPGGGKRTVQVAFSASVAVSALAYIRDGYNYGMISTRMSALFSLPYSGSIYIVVSVIFGVMALLGYRVGSAIVEWRRDD